MLNELLATAEQAARAAGAEARRWFVQGVEPRDKGYRQWVTEGDTAAQSAALAVIRGRYPEHAILAEEGYTAPGQAGREAIPDGLAWIIDPVDGTTNFARRLPFFNVSVGAAIDGQPAVGVVYDPLRESLFAAVRGQGATLNGHPLEVGGRESLAEAVVGFDSPPEPELRRRQWAAVSRVAARCRTVRALGSAALGMAYVAAGRLDAYVHLGVHPWDVAVGALLVEEAGGVVRQADGERWQLGQPSVVMCNSLLLASLLEALGVSGER